MIQLVEGMHAPEFAGATQNGETISLSDFKGKKLILYFYPKDNTPGCTAESCNLSDNYEFWREKGYDVIGVSPDSETSHQKFIQKYELKFNLIADTSKEILQAYGVWGEKVNYGKTYICLLYTSDAADE